MLRRKNELDLKGRLIVTTKKDVTHSVTIDDPERLLIAKFKFENGELRGMDSNLPYRKTREQWEFYATSILVMLSESKRFFKQTKD